MIDTILFDLDGTLLFLDEDKFTEVYFSGLKQAFYTETGNDSSIIDAILAGTWSMIDNDGSMSNEERFWQTFATFGLGSRETVEPIFERYYRENFDSVKISSRPNPGAVAALRNVIAKGYRLVLATNPLFPQIATSKRIGWLGLEPKVFQHVTTYENSRQAKPNLAYYETLLSDLALDPTRCLMIGNDVDEDMIIEKLGVRTYLVTDCLINRSGKSLSLFNHGDFEALAKYLEQLPVVKK